MSSIWHHRDSGVAVDRESQDIERWRLLFEMRCIFCKQRLTSLGDFQEERSYGFDEDGIEIFTPKRTLILSVCPVCGWWKFIDKGDHGFSLGTVAILRQLDLKDITHPIAEIRTYLIGNYEKRLDVHPRLFEEVVASVFRDIGYDSMVTAYTSDGGIDVILRKGASEVGVQVKRYRSAIRVEQIRSFLGALMLRDLTKGIFVTTSNFQRGAQKAAEAAEIRGYHIELLDAERFFGSLCIAKRKMYETIDEFLSCNPREQMKLVPVRY